MTAKTPRADKGPRITERDMHALEWIAQQYTVSIDHLCILLARLRDPEEQLGPTTKEEGELIEKRTLKIVRRWEALELIKREWILHDQPQWVYLTNQGLNVQPTLGELRPNTPTPARINQLYWCNHARLFLEQKRPNATWISERELRSNQSKIELGQKLPHTPDAVRRGDRFRKRNPIRIGVFEVATNEGFFWHHEEKLQDNRS